MSRPHIEFIQSQNLEWVEQNTLLEIDGIKSKILSSDSTSGAFTCILNFPKGWKKKSISFFDADFEFYVLEGSLSISEVEYYSDDYAHLPSGYPQFNSYTKTGVVLLAFFDKKVETTFANKLESIFDKDRLVKKISCKNAEWNNVDLESMGLTEISTGSRLLSLFTDPINGEITYLTGIMPFQAESSPEHHPVAQEFYVLGGSLAGNCGIMHSGAYCWRPPFISHGPYGSPSGALVLLRSIGGPLTTTIESKVKHTYTPDHNPILPEHLKDKGKKQIPKISRY
ncbi:DUF4437 domain-containing protein [Alphaproteobacteria bacterium]|nr:DUF4437 domain-containing protein [Alphaproteobacteria bacterium]